MADEVKEAKVVTGVSGAGAMVNDAPLTTTVTRQESPGLLLNEVDQRITKIRPMSTPIDQISRHAGSRKAGAMIVDYYSVDTKPTKAVTTEATALGNSATVKIDIDNLFDIGDTILAKDVKGYEADGKTVSNSDLVLYVQNKSDDGYPVVIAVNGSGENNQVPVIPNGTTLIRMGRAATELDVQTAQFEALPKKDQNYCQIFKMQVEQSTYQRMTNKEVDWNFSDIEEIAVSDMRLAIEKSYLFGVRRLIKDNKKKSEVYLTGGIWWQAGKEFEYDKEKDIDAKILTNMLQDTFTGNSGNKRKILIAGSNLINKLNTMEYQKNITAKDKITIWGIDFDALISKFGTLYVLHSEVFDDVDMPDCGLILDPEYLTKWSFETLDRLKLDLKTPGIRNTDGVVLTEASCLTLRYPACHMRIVPKA